MGGCVGLLEKESYNRWALIGVSAFLIAESAVLIPLSMAESNESGSFACYDSGEKKTSDGLRERCYEQYDQLNNTSFPLCAFGWLEFLLMLFLSIVYSVRMAPRVDELKQARSRPVSPKWKLFTVYVGHLLIRFALVTLFLVLQWTIYPVSFPETFSCSETLNNSTNSSANGNAMVTTYRYCENPQAKVKSIYGYVMFAANALFWLFSSELIYLRYKYCSDVDFSTDETFYQKHLAWMRCKPTQRDEEDGAELLPSEQRTDRWPAPNTTVSLEERVVAFQKSLIRKIISDTEEINMPIPSHEEAAKMKTDDLFVNALIQEGRRRLGQLIQEGLREDQMTERRQKLLDHYPEPEKDKRIFKDPMDLFSEIPNSGPPRAVLAVGCAGIGKSCVSKKILREWAKRKSANENKPDALQGAKKDSEGSKMPREDFVFFFEFRALNEKGDMSLKDLLRYSQYSEHLDDELLMKIFENPKQVLLVFDGLDEARSIGKSMRDEGRYNNEYDLKMPVGALFAKLTKGRLLREATVLTTTRPTALKDDVVYDLFFEELTSTEIRVVEILGFTGSKIQDYISRFCSRDSDLGDRIWEHLKANVNLLSLCYVPVNCSIVCSSLFDSMTHENIEGASGQLRANLPTTLTEIYKGALKYFTRRHHSLYRHGKANAKIEATFPDDNEEETLQKLGLLAKRGVEDRKLIFGEEDIWRIARTDDEFQDMVSSGLLRELPKPKPHLEQQYCFIHLTLQEFLAATVISSGSRKEIGAFSKASYNKPSMEMVFRFVAGLLRGRRKDSRCIGDLLKPLRDRRKDRAYRNCIGDLLKPLVRHDCHSLLLVHCLFELQDNDEVKRLPWKDNAAISYALVNDSDCVAVAFSLKHWTGIKLNLAGSFIGPTGTEKLAELVRDGNLSELDMSGSPVSDVGVKHLKKALQNENCKLTELNLSHNELTDEAAKHLKKALQNENCKLTELNLSDNELTDEVARHLKEALQNENCKLTELNLTGNQFTDEAARHLKEALQNENCKLTKLNLSDTELTDEAARHLKEALQNENCKLTKLNLSDTELTDEAARHLKKALQNENCKLKELNLSANELTDEAARHLKKALQNENCKLTKLNLSDTELTDEAARHLKEALQNENCKLTELNLSFNELTDEAARHLKEALQNENCKLTELNLSDNELTDEAAKHLEEALTNENCELTVMDLCSNQLTDEAAKHLKEALQNKNCKLTELNLSRNRLTDVSMSYLKEAVCSENCKLTTLTLHGVRFTSEGEEALRKTLESTKCKLIIWNTFQEFNRLWSLIYCVKTVPMNMENVTHTAILCRNLKIKIRNLCRQFAFVVWHQLICMSRVPLSLWALPFSSHRNREMSRRCPSFIIIGEWSEKRPWKNRPCRNTTTTAWKRGFSTWWPWRVCRIMNYRQTCSRNPAGKPISWAGHHGRLMVNTILSFLYIVISSIRRMVVSRRVFIVNKGQ